MNKISSIITRRRHFLVATLMGITGVVAVACAHILRLPPREANQLASQLASGQAATAEGPGLITDLSKVIEMHHTDGSPNR
jgi:hypothetical protein